MSAPGPGRPTDEPVDGPRPERGPAPDHRTEEGSSPPAGHPVVPADGHTDGPGVRRGRGPGVGRGDGPSLRQADGPGVGGGEGPAVGEADGPAGAGEGEVDAAASAAAARKRQHAIRGTLAAALCLEALTVLFVPRTVARVGDGGLTGARLTVLIVIAALLLLAAGLVKRRAGLVLGSVLQVAVIATGVLVGAMYFLGLLFAGVWAYVLWVRQEILTAAQRAGAPG